MKLNEIKFLKSICAKGYSKESEKNIKNADLSLSFRSVSFSLHGSHEGT